MLRELGSTLSLCLRGELLSRLVVGTVTGIVLALLGVPLALAPYVVLLFAAVQFLDGYLLLPLVERKTVSLPPALTITMQALMSLAFGLVDVALAAPLMAVPAVLAVLIAMLYVKDALDDQVTLPGKKG